MYSRSLAPSADSWLAFTTTAWMALCVFVDPLHIPAQVWIRQIVYSSLDRHRQRRRCRCNRLVCVALLYNPSFELFVAHQIKIVFMHYVPQLCQLVCYRVSNGGPFYFLLLCFIYILMNWFFKCLHWLLSCVFWFRSSIVRVGYVRRLQPNMQC